jgi:hypothetical protein
MPKSHPPQANRRTSKPTSAHLAVMPAQRALTATAVAPGVQQSYQAFRAALPELLQREGYRGSWAAYHGNDFVAIAAGETQLYQMCQERGFPVDSFYVGWIMPPSPDVIEDVDPSLFEFQNANLVTPDDHSGPSA